MTVRKVIAMMMMMMMMVISGVWLKCEQWRRNQSKNSWYLRSKSLAARAQEEDDPFTADHSDQWSTSAQWLNFVIFPNPDNREILYNDVIHGVLCFKSNFFLETLWEHLFLFCKELPPSLFHPGATQIKVTLLLLQGKVMFGGFFLQNQIDDTSPLEP